MPRVWLSLAEGKTKKPQPNWLRSKQFFRTSPTATPGLSKVKNEKRGQKVSYFS